MSPKNQLRRLAELIDRIEQSGLDLLRVTSKDPIASDEPPSVNVKARLPLVPPETVDDITISSADMTSDGTLDVEFVATVNPAEIDNMSTDRPAAEIQSTQSGNQKAQVQNQSSETPAYKDPELLEEVYESHDTFPEMRQALDVDVTAETVRLHMIEQGIHDPESTMAKTQENGSRTQNQDPTAEGATSVRDEQTTPATNGHSTKAASKNGHDKQTTPGVNGHSDEVQTSASKEATKTDSETTAVDVNSLEGVDLPERVTIEDIVEALKNARTIHEVEIKLDIDRADARQLLKKFDMLDTVMGRLKEPTEQDVTTEEIKERVEKVVS